jgi:hypothetical protein
MISTVMLTAFIDAVTSKGLGRGSTDFPDTECDRTVVAMRGPELPKISFTNV